MNTSGKSGTEKALQVFSDMMIKRMEEMRGSDWTKGWFNSVSGAGMPQNLSGRRYSGYNVFFLQILREECGYKTPIFLTFNQVSKEGACVNKGEKAFPVIFWDFSIKDKDGKKLTKVEYNNLSKSEKNECTVIPFMKSYYVFNLDQTNFKDVKPEKYQKYLDAFAPRQISDATGMYSNPALDRMFENQEWLCPVHSDKPSDRAFFSPSKDIIVLPMKAQFKKGTSTEEIFADGMEFYSTALHEMAHSTGAKNRLNRLEGGMFGDAKYAKEELVAELTAAMIGNSLGFNTRIVDNNAAYLSNWISALKTEPKFIVSLMADVNKAANMIQAEIEKQELVLGVKNIASEPDLSKSFMMQHFLDKEHIIAGYIGDQLLGKIYLSDKQADFFDSLSQDEKQIFINSQVKKNFDKQIDFLLSPQAKELQKLDFSNSTVFKSDVDQYQLRLVCNNEEIASKPISKQESLMIKDNMPESVRNENLNAIVLHHFLPEVKVLTDNIAQGISANRKTAMAI